MINNRLTALEQVLQPTNKPRVGEYKSIYFEGETTPQAIADKYNDEHGTNYPLEAFNLTAIVFTKNPAPQD